MFINPTNRPEPKSSAELQTPKVHPMRPIGSIRYWNTRDFEQWMDAELKILELRFAGFVTTKSNRHFFKR